jgi:Tfp pilus assembly protein PilX
MRGRLFPRGTKGAARPRTQRGATLIVGLIMMVLITLIVLSAFTLSSSNLKSVGNMQMREEAIAAANEAIELVISSAFTNAPVAQSINVDINKDGINDYVVAIATPTCVRALMGASTAPSDSELGTSMSSGSTWNTSWDIDSTVTDVASGASVRIRQGVSVLLSDTQKTTVCP